MDSAHMAIALGRHHWSQLHHANSVIHPTTGKEMAPLCEGIAQSVIMI
jgi:hypothetical protein